jgi:hypothetical protein
LALPFLGDGANNLGEPVILGEVGSQSEGFLEGRVLVSWLAISDGGREWGDIARWSSGKFWRKFNTEAKFRK